MPMTLHEQLESRKVATGDNPSVEFNYRLTGTPDDDTALATVQASTATTYNGLVRQTINLEPEWVDTNAGDGAWKVTVRYGLKPVPQVGKSTFSFDTGGGTQHTTQSLSTVNKYAPFGKRPPPTSRAPSA